MALLKTISVDPGISGTGYAVWEGKTLTACGNIYGKGEVWQVVAGAVADRFHELFVAEGPHKVVIEFPQHFEGLTGRTAESKGDTLKLACLAGMLTQIARRDGTPVYYVTPNQHKGNLPKSIVEQRIRKKIPESVTLQPKSHSYDAISIGYFHLFQKMI
jgi:hypothetical protein